ncbi:MAG: HAD-IA family hydrolase [Lentisphaeria bacterium]|nr:HAD-IA family hydrolase [Lentisphaeria bacterium]
MNKPDLMIFDLDGTLINSIRDLAVAISALRTHYGLSEVDVATASTMVGNGAVNLVHRALAGLDVDYDAAIKYYREYYAAHQLVYTKLYPGVAEGLAELKRNGVVLAVVTNKPSPDALAILKALGAAELLAEICGGDSGLPLKPEPDALLDMKKRFGARKCWMVGDHYTDLEAGRRAGFFRVWARYGFGQPREEVPDMTVDSFAELVEAALK